MLDLIIRGGTIVDGTLAEPREADIGISGGKIAQVGRITEKGADESEGELAGTFELGASTGPGGIVLAHLLPEFADRNPLLHVSLLVFDTQTVVEKVAERDLELGVVGAARRHRGVAFEPFAHDRVVLACPPGHPFAGREVTLDELRTANLIVMQEGAGVRQMIEDELRSAGLRLRDLNVRLELGLQESVLTAVRAGHGVTFISRASVVNDLASGAVSEATVVGLELERELFLVRATGRAESRAAREFLAFARDRVDA